MFFFLRSGLQEETTKAFVVYSHYGFLNAKKFSEYPVNVSMVGIPSLPCLVTLGQTCSQLQKLSVIVFELTTTEIRAKCPCNVHF